MCDEDDEDIVPEGGDLHKHLLANGLCDFEVYERSPRQTHLKTQITNMESKMRSMSLLNMLIPYKTSNLPLIREIRDCHLLLEEDALCLESLCDFDVDENTNMLRTVCIGTAISLPILLLCHVPRGKLLSITCTGLGLFSIRQVVGNIRQGMDQKLMRGLINALKAFSAICRKSQSLAQEWETVAGNMNVLKDTALFRAKMCGIDELKSDLVRFLRLCVINLTESSRDIVHITTGTDLHPLCMEVMRSEVMIEQNSSLSKAKKLHYLLVLVQSDYLKNVAASFMPSTKPIYNVAACVATVKNCIAYTVQYFEECTRILTDKYDVLKNFTPQARMTESVYKLYNRVSTFGDVRQTVNNITVCLEALTLQSLLAQRTLERYDDSANGTLTNVADIDYVCNSTQDTLLGLQADLHSMQCSVELAVKQLTRLRRAGIEKQSHNQTEQEQNGALHNRRSSELQTSLKPSVNLSDIPDNIRDEVFELYERSSLDDFDNESDRPDSLQETIQKRAEQRVAGRLMKELKTVLISKRAEMSAREEIARSSTQSSTSTNISRRSSTPSQTRKLKECKPKISGASCDKGTTTDSSLEHQTSKIKDTVLNKSTNTGLIQNISSDIVLTQNKSTNIDLDTLTQDVSNNLCRISTENDLKENTSINLVNDKSTQHDTKLFQNLSTEDCNDLELRNPKQFQNLNFENDLQVSEVIVKPDVCFYKTEEDQINQKPKSDFNVVDSVCDMFSIADTNASSTTIQTNFDQEDKNYSRFNENKIWEDISCKDSIQHDSNLESVLTINGFPNITSLKDLETNPEKYNEFNFIVNDDKNKYMEVQVLSKMSNFKTLSLSDEDRVDSKICLKALNSSRIHGTTDDELSISTGDYLLKDLPRRPKAQRNHAPSRQRYKYEPESGDNKVMGFKLPNDAVAKAREMKLMGAEECFGSSD